MKYFKVLKKEQKTEVSHLKKLLKPFTEKAKLEKNIVGALLTGSVARGDARIGPFGIMIDMALVIKNNRTIDLTKIFGKDTKPFIPYLCININKKVGLAIETIKENDLHKIISKSEEEKFAKNESLILFDTDLILHKWKKSSFKISTPEIKSRALSYYFRYNYLIGEYRNEKWFYREAYTQVSHNINEAVSCYCKFLYCINKSFIPRADWLIYLTYELKVKPEKHEELLKILFSNSLSKSSLNKRINSINLLKKWMTDFCQAKKWL